MSRRIFRLLTQHRPFYFRGRERNLSFDFYGPLGKLHAGVAGLLPPDLGSEALVAVHFVPSTRMTASQQRECTEKVRQLLARGYRAPMPFIVYVNKDYVLPADSSSIRLPEYLKTHPRLVSEVMLDEAQNPSVDVVLDEVRHVPAAEHDPIEWLIYDHGGPLASALKDLGLSTLNDVNVTALAPRQQWQVEAHRLVKPRFRTEEVQTFLDKLSYPLQFLDFETYSDLLPHLEAASPTHQIPFQFSLHIREEPDGRLRHHAFLAEGSSDPRFAFLRELRRTLRPTGSVLIYTDYEIRCLEQVLRDLEKVGPAVEYEEALQWYEQLRPRFVDLHAPFQRLDIYHPLQKGRTGLKAAVAGFGITVYNRLAISKGADAAVAYQQLRQLPPSHPEARRMRLELLAYCGTDTEVMAHMVHQIQLRAYAAQLASVRVTYGPVVSTAEPDPAVPSTPAAVA